jgi:hypothetical protein
MSVTEEKKTGQVSEYEENEVVRQFKLDVACGKNWFLALLEAIGRWTKPEETIGGRTYKYLIGGEAFDWLLLAERLLYPVKEKVPIDEVQNLLFYGKPPVVIAAEEFETFFGETKYRQYLNFFYGITAEEALFLSVQEEVRKDRRNTILHSSSDYEDEVYRRIYDETKTVLLKQFRKDKGYHQSYSISLTESREFTYWLFKYRVEHCDRSRVASDTKKAMEFLKSQYANKLEKGEDYT